MDLDKATIEKCRKKPPAVVAALLDYHGPVLWKNAIDMVMELRDCPYNEALSFLHQRLAAGEVPRGGDVKGDWLGPLTPQEKAIRAAWRAELDALGADRYRVTAFHRDDRNRTRRIGKHHGETVESFYSADQLLQMVPMLSKLNWSQNYQIYITAFSDDVEFFLIDDVSVESKLRMDAEGFRPRLLLRSSWNSWQAIIAVPKSDFADDPDRRLINFVFRQMNISFGDVSINSQRHPFRACGFQNRKIMYERDGRFPIAELVESDPGSICDRTREYVRQCAVMLASQPPSDHETEQKLRVATAMVTPDGLSRIKQCQPRQELVEFAQNSYRRMQSLYDPFDASRADYTIARSLIARSATPLEVVKIIIECSPDLAIRPHPDMHSYAVRTARKANAAMSQLTALSAA